MSWRQWQALLIDNGFHHAHCMQGDTFLRGQAVIVGENAASGNGTPAAPRDGVHFFSGGLGGLGLLTARLLVEGGAFAFEGAQPGCEVVVVGINAFRLLLRRCWDAVKCAK